MKTFVSYTILLGALGLGFVAMSVIAGCNAAGQSEDKAAAKKTDAAEEVAAEEEAPKADATDEEVAAKKEETTQSDDSESPADEVDNLSAVDKTANAQIKPGDWPQWCGTSYRNNTPIAEGIPTHWDVGTFDRKTKEYLDTVNIKWYAKLGSQTYGNAVVASGQIYVGTNNGGGYLSRYPADVDLGVLLCLSEKDGSFLWQHSSEKLSSGRVHDWPLQGICCAPYTEGERVWFVSSQGKVICLDTQGYHDGEDDGMPATWARLFNVATPNDPDIEDQLQPALEALEGNNLNDFVRSEFERVEMKLPDNVMLKPGDGGKSWTFTAKVNDNDRNFRIRMEGPRLVVYKFVTPVDKREADTIWELNMMSELGVSQHNMCSCSVTALGDILFVNTSNGLDESHENLPAPNAPSFIAVDKNTGEVFWTDRSPGTNILHGQWSSPTVATLGGVPQVLFAGGDGWVYSFRADKGKDGKPEFLWKFDCNPKESKWMLNGRGTRNNIIATPVVYDGLVYVAVGQDPEHLNGEGHLWCINPNKRGDVSAELAMKLDGDKRVPIEHRRIQAVIPEDGEVAVDNPNSAAVWHYAQADQNGDGKFSFEEKMHRSCGTVAIKNDLLYIADFAGIVHCLDAKTGKVHFTYDMFASSWGSPLIVGDKVYIGDEDGEVSIFNLSADPKVAMKDLDGELVPINADENGDVTHMLNSVYSTPIVANGVLYISNKNTLFAIAEDDAE